MDLKSFKHRLAFLVQELTADCAQSRLTSADAGRPRAAEGGGESACGFADSQERSVCGVPAQGCVVGRTLRRYTLKAVL